MRQQKTRFTYEASGFRDCIIQGDACCWCRLPVSNWPPDDYKSTALPNELSRRNLYGANYTLFNSREGGTAALFGRLAVVVRTACSLAFQRGLGRRDGGGNGGQHRRRGAAFLLLLRLV